MTCGHREQIEVLSRHLLHLQQPTDTHLNLARGQEKLRHAFGDKLQQEPEVVQQALHLQIIVRGAEKQAHSHHKLLVDSSRPIGHNNIKCKSVLRHKTTRSEQHTRVWLAQLTLI